MKALAVLAVALLAGCAGITETIQKREQLYGAQPLHAPAPAPTPAPTPAPAAAAYTLAGATARAEFSSRLGTQTSAVVGLVDAGIALANSNCRAYLSAVSSAEQRWKEGETNVGVLSALITGALAAAGVHNDVLVVWGLGSAAWQGYSQGFVTNVLGMSDYDTQTKVREAMGTRAADLRAQAPTMTYPQAVDVLEEYLQLCTPQAAKALSRSALTAVKTTVAPTGAITTKPADVASTFVKDDSSERINAWWAPADVVDKVREARIRKWMDDHGANVSITFFSHAKIYEQARKQMVADLNIPPVGQVAPSNPPTSERTPEVRDGAFIARALGLQILPEVPK